MYYPKYPRGYQNFSSEEERLGYSYERFVAGYFEKEYGCAVVPQGHLLGVLDGGIDLIALTNDTTYLIQCKYYRTSSLIYSKHVSQLRGDANMFVHKFPSAKNIKAVLVAHCRFASDAVDNAKVNDVELMHLNYSPGKYAPGANYISDLLPDYEKRLTELILAKQYNQRTAEAIVESSAAEADQGSVKVDQKPAESDQNPLLDDDTAPVRNNISTEERIAVERGFLYYFVHYDSKSTFSARKALLGILGSLLKITAVMLGIICLICICAIPIIGPVIVVIFLIALVIALAMGNKRY